MEEKRIWWKEAIGYQIYPKSFCDSNGDGIGDILGIVSKLDYIKKLGVNLIWICPIYDSPMDDNGYDVRDYFKIDKTFGEMRDFDLLLKEAHKRDIRIMMDLVLNHTSDEHQWFIESSKRNGKYTDYYIWQDPIFDPVTGRRHVPTNWWSFFGGTTWKWSEERQQYFMKIFSNKMPDLNWKNPDVVEDMSKMIKWWIDKGVDGFRIDAVAHLGKKPFVQTYDDSCANFSNLPLVHDVLRHLNENLFTPNNIATVGEVGGSASFEEQLSYTKEDAHQLNMIFTFDHAWCNNPYAALNKMESLKLDIPQLKYALVRDQEVIKRGGWLGIYWMNHDHPRVLSHYGNLDYPFESATALATALYFMKGTPFIYNGEEIGMTNYHFKVDEFDDIGAKRLIMKAQGEQKKYEYERQLLICKDHARTIMQWNDRKYAGFSTNKPWFVINPNYKKVNVEAQEKEKDSILNHYRLILNLRKSNPDVFVYGDFKPHYMEDPNVLCYDRIYKDQIVRVIVNLSDKNVRFASGYFEKICYHNYFNNYDGRTLKPYESVVLKIK